MKNIQNIICSSFCAFFITNLVYATTAQKDSTAKDPDLAGAQLRTLQMTILNNFVDAVNDTTFKCPFAGTYDRFAGTLQLNPKLHHPFQVDIYPSNVDVSQTKEGTYSSITSVPTEITRPELLISTKDMNLKGAKFFERIKAFFNQDSDGNWIFLRVDIDQAVKNPGSKSIPSEGDWIPIESLVCK